MTEQLKPCPFRAGMACDGCEGPGSPYVPREARLVALLRKARQGLLNGGADRHTAEDAVALASEIGSEIGEA